MNSLTEHFLAALIYFLNKLFFDELNKKKKKKRKKMHKYFWQCNNQFIEKKMKQNFFSLLSVIWSPLDRCSPAGFQHVIASWCRIKYCFSQFEIWWCSLRRNVCICVSSGAHEFTGWGYDQRSNLIF